MIYFRIYFFTASDVNTTKILLLLSFSSPKDRPTKYHLFFVYYIKKLCLSAVQLRDATKSVINIIAFRNLVNFLIILFIINPQNQW